MNTHARTTDPVSSHIAAEVNAKCRQTQIDRVASMVAERPGLTSAEMAHGFSAERHAVARRCPDAEKMNLIKRGDLRKCAVSDRLAVTWWPV